MHHTQPVWGYYCRSSHDPFLRHDRNWLVSLLILVSGASVAAIVTFCIGATVIFVADHFVRPTLIGGTTKLPFLWVLLGILGGAEMWGLIGLFIGPAAMAALNLIWQRWAYGNNAEV